MPPTPKIHRPRRHMRILPILAALAFAASACSRTVPTATVPAIGSASPAPSAAEPSTTAVATATATAGTPTPTPPPTPVPPPETYPLPCGEADPTCLSLAVKTQRGINYTGPVACGQDGATCLMQLDTFAPPATKRLPVVVMIPGGPVAPGIRDSMWNLARLVAARGAVVFAADYRSGPQWGGGYPQTFGDVACAIRFARQHAPELGGDPARVTLVAHSFGGFPASVTALSRHDFATDEPECLTTTGDGRPNALVGVAAIYGFDHIGQDFLAQMLGGMRDEVPDAWAAADITVLAAAKHHPTPPVRLLAGTADLVAPIATADEFATLLRDAGIDVTVTAVDGADHGSILAKPVTVDTIAALIGASGF